MDADDGRPIRVLHVEDDADFADLAATQLEREHEAIAVRTADDAREGLSVIESGAVDCVVSDFDMPGADGLEFLEAVRERDPDLPFILYTGKGSEEIASEAIAAGVTDYLQKGGGTEQYAVLANRIEHAVERQRADEELRAERRRYELLGRASADAFWDWDLETGDVERSEGFGRLFGHEAADVGDDTEWWRERIHPGDRDEVEAAIDGAIERGEEVYEADYRFRNADGSYSDVIARGFIVYDGDEPVRVVGTMTDVSGIKARERELEQVRTRLELVLDGTNTGVWEWNTVTDEVIWDETVERLFGVPPGDFEGTYGAFRDRILEGDVDRVEAAIEHTVETSAHYDVEFRIRRNDGEVRWVRAEGVFDEGQDGEGERMIGLISDVSERKEREERLKRAERRFDAVFDDPAVFIGLLDTGGEILRVNRRAASFVDRSPESLVGEDFLEAPWWRTSDDEELKRMRAGIERAADGEFVRFETEHVGAGGQRVSIDGHIRPVTDDDGSVVSLLVEGVDVSDRVERERMIERLHESTRSLVRAEEPEAVAERVVDSVEEVLGFPSAVVRLRRGDQLPPVAMSDGARESLGERPVYGLSEGPPGRAIEAGEPVIVDDFDELDDGYGRGTHRSGLYVPIGEHGAISIGNDRESAFDRADVALARVLANNAASVLDRLEGERAIRRRERELARQNDRLEQFTGVISHDLKGPLNVALGRLDLLDAETSVVESALGRMDELLDDVHELAREGRVVGDPAKVDLADLARSAWGTVVTGEAALEVGDVDTVEADETRLRELLENLFRNAVEHGGEGVAVRVEATADGFAVEDDGPGIPAEERSAVFEPGFTTRDHGTGFGLAIVESIATAHGWEVRVAEGERGARFEIVTDPAE